MEELLETTGAAGEMTEPAPETAGESDASPAAQPAEPPQAQPEETAALERELARLRQEKHHRLLMDEASALLSERGIDPQFAPFVLGEDSAATRKRAEQFDRLLAAALRKHLAARLPKAEPRDFSAAKPPQRRRGIRRV